jgi:hypothetical protein
MVDRVQAILYFLQFSGNCLQYNQETESRSSISIVEMIKKNNVENGIFPFGVKNESLVVQRMKLQHGATGRKLGLKNVQHSRISPKSASTQ